MIYFFFKYQQRMLWGRRFTGKGLIQSKLRHTVDPQPRRQIYNISPRSEMFELIIQRLDLILLL